MSYSVATVKNIIEDFIEAQAADTLVLQELRSDKTANVNLSIYELESYLVELRQRYDLNQRIDTNISFPHTQQHFDSINSSDAFQKAAYQLPLLY